MKDFSEKLKKRLKEKGITQGVLCEKIEVTPTGLINSIKNNNLKVETLEKICKILEVGPDYFLEVNPQPTGIWKRLLDEANVESNRWKMRAFELEEKMSHGNFRKLSKNVNPFLALRKKRNLLRNTEK